MSTATPSPPFDRGAAIAQLRRLGRELDRQVTQQTGATPDALDATLRLMRLAHDEIVRSPG